MRICANLASRPIRTKHTRHANTTELSDKCDLITAMAHLCPQSMVRMAGSPRDRGPHRKPDVKIAAGLYLFSILALSLSVGIGLSAAAVGVAYKAEILGVEDDALRETLLAVSQLVAETERPPPTLEALKRRAEDDLPRLDEALASLGYYGAALGYDIDTKASPVRVTIHVKPGEPYHLAGYHITGDNPALSNGEIRITAETLGLQQGMVAAAKPVVDGEPRLWAARAAPAR